MRVGTRLYKSSSSDIKGKCVVDSKSLFYYTIYLNNKEPVIDVVYIDNNKQYDLLKWLDYNCLLLFEDYDNEFFLFSSYLHSKLTSNLDIIYYMEPYYGFTPEYLSISSIKFMYRRFKSLSFFALFTHIDFHDLLHPLIRLLSNYFSIHLSKPTSSIIKYTFLPNPHFLFIYD